MISVTQFDVAGDDEGFLARGRAALVALAARPGYRGGSLGRSTDDEGAWVMVTEWADVGSYRRALGAFEVKMAATPLLAQALDRPSAFEQLVRVDADQTVTLAASDRA